MNMILDSVEMNFQQQRHEFNRILQNRDITTYYQPIVCLKNSKPFGYEALTRGPKNYFFNPLNLFLFAERENQLFPLEKLARESAVQSIRGSINNGEKLFLNFSPKIIHDPNFSPGVTKSLLEQHHLTPEDVIFEITERHAIDDFKTFRKALNHYRNQGFQIAVDDAGAGYSSALAISELAPDYIKIDRSLVSGINHSDVKEKIVEAFISIAKKCNSKVIAEGIETKEDLSKILDLNVDYAQGFFIGHPSNPIQQISEKSMLKIKKKSLNKNTIQSLASPIFTLDINCTPSDLTEVFLRNKNLEYILITNENVPASLVKRTKWCKQELTFGKVHPCQYSRNFISVDFNDSVQEVINHITSKNDSSIQEIVVIQDHVPVGVVTVIAVLKYLSKNVW